MSVITCEVKTFSPDLVIWDPTATKMLGKEEQLSKCDFSVYEGLEVTGAPEYVIFKVRPLADTGPSGARLKYVVIAQ